MTTPNIYPPCQCTWQCYDMCDFLARYGNLGNGTDWAANAEAKGLTVSSTPIVGSVLCLQQYTQGTGVYGHVAVVTGISGDTVTVSQMDVPFGNCNVTTGQYKIEAGARFIYPPGGTELSSQEFTQLQTELDQQKQDYQSNITQLQQQFNDLRAATQSEVQQLQAEIDALKAAD